MGIIFQVKIRCFKVKDVDKVDLTVLSEGKDYIVTEAYKAELQAYYKASKDNVEKLLALYDHDPGLKRGYTLTNILVPEETNVVAFGNNACDRMGCKSYHYVTFYKYNGKQIEKREVIADTERNNFMLLVPPETYSLSYENHGDERIYSYNYGPYSSLCGWDTNSDSDQDSDSDSDYDNTLPEEKYYHFFK